MREATTFLLILEFIELVHDFVVVLEELLVIFVKLMELLVDVFHWQIFVNFESQIMLDAFQE